MEELRILELFSGIGGMHYAFKKSQVPGHVVAAIDINPVANAVYKSNYPSINVMSNNVQSITKQFVEKLNVNTILMSPPCQPFTRVGNKKDVDDRRTDALKHICDILEQLETIKYILMENVLGFEKSQARDIYVASLARSGFVYREFCLSPNQFGIPNSRMRYYCIARRKEFDFLGETIHKFLPSSTEYEQPFPLKEILESNVENYLIPDTVLRKRVWLMDIVYPLSCNSTCFTKAYTHYAEGTGSVLCEVTKEKADKLFEQLKKNEQHSEESLTRLRSIKLRYFTPREVARLMSFPDEFQFPEGTTRKQLYRLLGNSINVFVVSELIKVLAS